LLGHSIKNTGTRIWAAAFGLLVLLLAAGVARADVEPINLTVAQDDVGFMGQIKPGLWNPIRLTIENPSATPMAVDCQWSLKDFDKDIVIASRHVTVPARRKQTVWVYGCVPVTAMQTSNPEWKIQVIESDTKQVLAQKMIDTIRAPMADRRFIAMSGNSRLGLGDFSIDATGSSDTKLQVHHHELTQLARGLEAANLPDRWYGYDTLDALILTPDIDPTRIPPEVFAGMREWVKRGGHVVIVMPTVNESWSQSAGKDFLPDAEMVRKEGMDLPKWLGDPKKQTNLKLEYYTFVPKNKSMGVLYKDDKQNAVVVTRQMGFGAVTVLGINVTDGNLEALGLPNGLYNIWHRVFGWRAPAYNKATLNSFTLEKSETKIKSRGDEFEIDTLLVSSSGAITASIQLYAMAAIVIFAAYWLIAGPVSYLVLRVRKKTYHSWLTFFGVVVVFSAGVWAVAWVSRPQNTLQSHVTFYDMDVAQKVVRCQSWAQVSCPDFARQEVSLAPGERKDHTNTVACPGMNADKAMARGWVDVQTINIDAGAPNQQLVPFRSSAKLFQLRYFGRAPLPGQTNAADDPAGGNETTWPIPTGKVTAMKAGLSGSLTHKLPDALTNVILVYCPGDDEPPVVWRPNNVSWGPGDVLNLSNVTASTPMWLVRDPRGANWSNRQVSDIEGFLGGTLRSVFNGLGQNPYQHNYGGHAPDEKTVQEPTKVSIVQAISFFDMLPPPEFMVKKAVDQNQNPVFNEQGQADALVRGQCRLLDLSKLTTQPKLIVIGVMTSGGNPTPVMLGGRPVEGRGMTVVRYIFDVN
jgi:hypothetical protein